MTFSEITFYEMTLCEFILCEVTFYEFILCEVTCDESEWGEWGEVSWAAASLNNKNPNHKDMGKNQEIDVIQ